MACIAVVDDNPRTHETIQHIIGHEHQVIAYFRGTLAVDFLRDNRPDIAFVSLDLSDVDSLDLIGELTSFGDTLPVVVVCGSPDAGRIVAAIRAGAVDAISLPLLASDLRRCVVTAIGGRAILPHPQPVDDQLLELIGHSDQIARLRSQTAGFAASNAPVLISGETGVGKELVAHALHKLSQRPAGPFEVRNCGAIPDSLFESELFGTERGAYTGAVRRPGAFELADNGTLFLDEVGELSALAQVKLLRALETKRFHRVGGSREIEVNVRIVTATNRNLGQCIKDGTFRQDLYYRINVLSLSVSPLRERREDIPLLVYHFLTRLSAQERPEQKQVFSADALARLSAYDWPGNVRELRNVVHRAILTAANGTIMSSDLVLG